MPEADDLHPSPELLSGLALGKLDEELLAIVGSHLAECATCRGTAASATDRFLELLRTDQREPPPVLVDPGESLVADDLPAPLRNHCRYRVIRTLGRGGMGSVYLAEHRLMKQLRAIKVINPVLIGNRRAAERFVREVELLSRLRHPAIVQGFDAEEAGGLYLLVMEYVEGEGLAQVLEREGPLPVALACEYARQVAIGLQYAHEQGLVHRDIKPANLMRTRAGEIKILDFGLARVASESGGRTGLTHEHAAMGTPDYSAPEQWLDAHNADIGADIYSLGCTLFSLLTAKPPFERPSAQAVFAAHLHEPPRSLRELRPDAPEGVCDLVQRMLAKLPSQRPQTAAEVAACLTPFITQEATPARQEDPAAATISASRKRRSSWVAVAVASLTAVALLAWGAAVLRVRTPDGTIVLEQVPDGAEVFVDGRRIDLQLPGDKETTRIELPAGKRELRITKGGFEAFTTAITLVAGKSKTVKVSLTKTEEAEPKPPVIPSKDWVSLFNGRNLTGWGTFDGGAGGWKVEDGLIVGRRHVRDLFSQRGDFEDFHLRVEAMVSDGGDSGIYFRAPFVPEWPQAYQAQINASGRDAQKTGSLYNLAPFFKQRHKPDQWFTLEAIVRGEHIILKVDGITTVDLNDRRFKKGHFALEASDSPTVVKIRKFEVKELPASQSGR